MRFYLPPRISFEPGGDAKAPGPRGLDRYDDARHTRELARITRREFASAHDDFRELRDLLDAFNEAKKTAGLTIVKMLVTGLVLALLAGAFLKLKVFGGGQ